MQETKRCPKCGETKPFSEFSKDRGRKHGLGSYCRICANEASCENRWKHLDQMRASSPELYARCVEEYRAYRRTLRHRRGLNRPMAEAKDSSPWLGIHIAERVLSNYFDNVTIMPYGNPGFDFVCSKNYKIDVKSGCLRGGNKTSPRWSFAIRKNQIADYFLCLAFDNRESLEPQHVWLIPGGVVNNKTGIHIANTQKSRVKWKEYEKPLDKVIACCATLRASGFA